MFDMTEYGLLAAGDDGLMQIIMYVIIGAFFVIGNITKARAQQKQQKRTRHTGVPRSKPKPSAQRLQSQESPPTPSPERTERPPKYYAPGGFAEALLDGKLEETLKKRAKKVVKSYAGDTTSASVSVKPIESTEIMNHDLENIGHLETLDPAVSSQEDPAADALDLISIDSPDDLARAVVYAEILSKPVGMRGF